ncbi:MAG: PKD domain-containing protein, partial [Bacteroidia bacterium]|nr:PKD domain-containing protein [Bacteroidia bacterium]
MKTIDNPLFLLKTIVRPFSFALLTMLVSLSNYAQSIAGSAALEDHTSVFTPLHKEDLSLKKDPSTGFMPDLSLLDQPMKREVTETQRKQIAQNIAALPISFRKNMGQWDNNIIYRGSSPGWNANINFMKNGLSFGFCRDKVDETLSHVRSAGSEEKEYMVWNLYFKGANANSNITSEGQEDSRTNYLLNPDLSKKQINVPDYRMLKYNNVYNNIDLRYYRAGKELKYDYVVQPGGNLSNIQMVCEGVEKLYVNDKGQLEITTKWGILLEELPESYQIINGKKKLVNISYKIIDGTTFGFTANGHYKSSVPLIIDPVNLVWCTMVGSDTGNGYMADIAIDAAGNVYGVTDEGGGTYPTTPGVYSTTLPFSSNPTWGFNIYVFKLNPTATTLVWATFVSTGRGNNTSDEKAIAVDAIGNVYVCGRTCPSCGGGGGTLITTPGAYDVTYNGPVAGAGNAYVIELNTTGTTLLYSTYLGSTTATEQAYDIAVSNTGLIYVTGYTQGASYPVTAGAYDISYNGGTDVFLSVLNPAGAGAADLVYSTFIGGSGADRGICLAVDAANRAYISGSTGSANFPASAGAYDNTFNGSTDVFVCKINPVGSGAADLVYSTFIGGAGGEAGNGIAINSAGEAFVTGGAAAGFPVTVGAYDVTFGTTDIFVSKLNSTGSSLLYSTFVDNINSPKIALSISSCENDEVFVSAFSNGTAPITPCAFRSAALGSVDVVLLKLKTAGAGAADLLYSTYFGGNAQDYNGNITAAPICASAAQEVFVGYTTHSTNTPTTPGVVGPTHPSGSDQPAVFKMKSTLPTFNYTYSIGACSNTVNFTGTASGNCIWQQTWTPNYWLWDFGDGQTSSIQNPTHVFGTPGTYNVKLIVGCPKDSITKSVVINPTVTVTTSFTNSSCAASNGTGTATPAGGTSPYTYSWSNGQTTVTATGLGAGTYTVTVRDANGCIGQKTITINASGTLTSSITPTNRTCTVPGSATSNPSGGTPSYTFSWSNGQVAQTATN